MFNECQRRDHVLAESLLETHYGKTTTRIMCKKETHVALKEFSKTLEHDLEIGDLELPLDDLSDWDGY